VIFYSGFNAETVSTKLSAIQKVFGDIEKVAKYDAVKVQKIIDSKKVIGNRRKINGIIYNANQIKLIQKNFGSFDNYLLSLGDTDNENNFFNLVTDLKKRFKYLGDITVNHFLTDLGYYVVKPDRVLSRIFYRLGLIDNEEDTAAAVEIGRRFSVATKLPIRYVDIIFVLYGQKRSKKDSKQLGSICLSKNPKCEICGIYDYCQYPNKN
jgi:DNA-3-methyladenine glycosylase I